LIADRLSKFTYLPISSEAENLAIALRRTRKLKLPDALIAATAIHHGLELLTLDLALQTVAKPIKT
jgi:predicted nucleic acid-binding protein